MKPPAAPASRRCSGHIDEDAPAIPVAAAARGWCSAAEGWWAAATPRHMQAAIVGVLG